MPDLRGKRALVTGASSGIGREMTLILAGWGCDLVICARRLDRLQALADEVKEAHGVDVRVHKSDLSHPDAARTLWEGLDEPVDILINNAGFGSYQSLPETPWKRSAELMQLNIVSLVELSYLFTRAARQRETRGYLLNVSSVVGYTPMPNFATYAASKSFVRSFSTSLAMELKRTRVTVTCLSPGATRTEFNEVAGQTVNSIGQKAMMSARRCARIGLRGMLRGRRNVVPGISNKLITFSTRLLPGGTIGAIAAAFIKDEPKKLSEKS